MTCAHEDFAAEVEVNRIEDIGAFVADVRIACAVCHERFCFVGLPEGASVNEPMMAPFGHEARLPIRPASEEWRAKVAPMFRITKRKE